MDLLLTDGVPVHIEGGRSVRSEPVLLLDGLVVAAGPFTDRDAHEKHVLGTDGSVDWFSHEHIDELRFDRATGLLRSFVLHVPEQPADPGDTGPARWLRQTPETGTLRLGEIRQFHLPATGRRWHTPTALVCSYPSYPDVRGTTEEPLRLRVADELDLVFAAGRLAGWALMNPAKHLSDGSTPSLAPSADRELAAALAHFLELSELPALDDLLNGEPHARERLERLRDTIRPTTGDRARRDVLCTRIDQLIDDWYDC